MKTAKSLILLLAFESQVGKSEESQVVSITDLFKSLILLLALLDFLFASQVMQVLALAFPYVSTEGKASSFIEQVAG